MSWQAALSQGATYAGAGATFGGPWGAAIGGGAGLLMGAFQDDPKDSQIDVQKLLGPDLKTLRQQSAESKQLGGQLTSMGTEGLAPVLSYYKSLLSGNPAATLAATAPDRGRVIDQYDTARKAIAQGPRGGGTTSAQANSQISQGNALQEILATARDKGAAGAAQVGGQVLGAGMQANALATQSLGQVISAVLGGAGLDVQQNQMSMAYQQQQGEAMGQLIGLLITSGKLGGKGGGGGGVGTAGIGGAIQPRLNAGLGG